MRFLPSDSRVKCLAGVADDRAIGYHDLAPLHDRNDIDFGIPGIAGDPACPDHPEYPLAPLPIQRWGERDAEVSYAPWKSPNSTW